jgi:hypothetical protein
MWVRILAELEDPMELISLKRAAQISGVSSITLRLQARNGRLRTVQPARDLLTTRTWLHEYLMSRTPASGRKPLPPDYVAPE